MEEWGLEVLEERWNTPSRLSPAKAKAMEGEQKNGVVIVPPDMNALPYNGWHGQNRYDPDQMWMSWGVDGSGWKDQGGGDVNAFGERKG